MVIEINLPITPSPKHQVCTVTKHNLFTCLYLFLQGCQILLPKWWWTAQDNATLPILWEIRWTQSGINIMICKWSRTATCCRLTLNASLRNKCSVVVCEVTHQLEFETAQKALLSQRCSTLVLLFSVSVCFRNAALYCEQKHPSIKLLSRFTCEQNIL